MDKEQIIEILLDAQIIDRYVEDSEINGAVDEILALHNKAQELLANQLGVSTAPADYFEHRPNCTSIVYGRTEDPAKCICHSWSRKRTYPIGDWEPIDYASIDPVKWEGVTTNPFTKRKSCPQELKDAYKAIREVREALLKLERKLE